MYDELIAELRQHHCDAKEDDTQEVCEECSYDVIIVDKSAPSGFASVCVCGLMNRAADAIETLEHHVFLADLACKAESAKAPRWIPVSERLPKEPGMYIVFLRCGAELQDPGFPDDLSYVTAMHFDFDQRIWNDGIESYNANLDVVNKPHAYYVTHWQPLPERPKEG